MTSRRRKKKEKRQEALLASVKKSLSAVTVEHDSSDLIVGAGLSRRPALSWYAGMLSWIVEVGVRCRFRGLSTLSSTRLGALISLVHASTLGVANSSRCYRL